MTPIKLTPSQRVEWDRVVTSLTFHCPAFTHIAYALIDRADDGEIAILTNALPVAGTDGKRLLINPESYFSKHLTLANRLFVLAHEISHVFLEHIVLAYGFRTAGRVAYKDGTSLPYDDRLMNQAMDYIINAMLITAKIGEMPTGPYAGLYDPKITPDGDADLVDVYRELHKQQKSQGQSKPRAGGQGSGQGSGQKGQSSKPGDEKGHDGGFCQHERPGSASGKTEHEAIAAHDPQQVAEAIAGAANAARLMGKLPAGLARIFDKLLTPTVDWRDHIRALMMRKAGSGGYDWQVADEELMMRDIYAPSRSGHGVGTVVCVLDTSGSVTQADYDLFYGNVAGMIDDLRPKKLHVIWCDMQINKSEEIEDAMELLAMRVRAGGGTDFRPAFDEVARLGLAPDALIYLTDGQGTFPDSAPDYAVIWGSIYEPSKYPFGDVVQVPRQISSK